VNIDFTSNDDTYYAFKIDQLNQVYKQWLKNVDSIKEFVIDEFNSMMKWDFPDVKLNELTEGIIDDLNADIDYSSQYKGHIPDIRIFDSEIQLSVLDFLSKIERQYLFIISIHNKYNLYLISFMEGNKSFEFEITEKDSHNYRLYFMYNGILNNHD